jgi:hypothetical protein
MGEYAVKRRNINDGNKNGLFSRHNLRQRTLTLYMGTLIIRSPVSGRLRACFRACLR